MKKKKNGMAYAYLAPTLITILLVTCLPILYTVILSFTNYNMYHLGDYTFVGADNYLTVFSGSIKSVFFPVLGWTICFAIFSTVGSYAMGLLLAILLNNPHMKESKIYRAILIVPWALPSTIAILAWQGLLNEQYGGINNLLHVIGIAWNIPWLTNPLWARIGLIIVNVWLGFPYMMNVCLGGLQSISTEYYEAAEIDGCNKAQTIFKIILPLSLPSLVSTGLYAFINAWNEFMFGYIFISTDKYRTLTPAIMLFKGVNTVDWGGLMAGSVVAVIPVTFIFLFLQRYFLAGLMSGSVKG